MAKKVIDEEMSNYPTAPSPVVDTRTEYQKFLESQLGKSPYGGVGSAGSATNYLGQAGQLLGSLDTSGFDALEKSLQSQYATGSQSLENTYQNLLASIGKQELQNKQQFAKARGTISENSFERGRDLFRALASRGLGASGLTQLGEVQNRMQTGREVSGVANQFYDTSENIAQGKQQGAQQYETQKQTLANQLQGGLANINQQEIQYKNAYQQNLASLAMQLQAQKQSQLNASASANAQNAQYQTQIAGELAKLKDAGTSTSTDKYASVKYGVAASEAPRSQKIAMLQSEAGMTRPEAEAYLKTFDTEIKTEKTTQLFDAMMTGINDKTFRVKDVEDRIKAAASQGLPFSADQIAKMRAAVNDNTAATVRATNKVAKPGITSQEAVSSAYMNAKDGIELYDPNQKNLLDYLSQLFK